MSFSITGGMGNLQWVLDLVVAVLLAATLLRAYRLDRALDALRRDRGALEALLSGFDASAQQARGGIDRLRELTDSAGRRVEQQSATALALKDDLEPLIERGERLVERLDHALRAVRAVAPQATRPVSEAPRAALVRAAPDIETSRVRSKAEQDLLLALQARG